MPAKRLGGKWADVLRTHGVQSVPMDDNEKRPQIYTSQWWSGFPSSAMFQFTPPVGGDTPTTATIICTASYEAGFANLRLSDPKSRCLTSAKTRSLICQRACVDREPTGVLALAYGSR
jgi:hypothetical protein